MIPYYPNNTTHLPHEDIRSSREVFSGRSLIEKQKQKKKNGNCIKHGDSSLSRHRLGQFTCNEVRYAEGRQQGGGKPQVH